MPTPLIDSFKNFKNLIFPLPKSSIFSLIPTAMTPNEFTGILMLHGCRLRLDKSRFSRWNFGVCAQNSDTNVIISDCAFDEMQIALSVCANSSAKIVNSRFHNHLYTLRLSAVLQIYDNVKGTVELKGNTMKNGQRPRCG